MPQNPLILPNGAPQKPKQPDVSRAKTVTCPKCGHNIFTLGFVLKEMNGLELGLGPKTVTAPLEVPNLFVCAKCGEPFYLNDELKVRIEALLAGDGSLAKFEEEDRKRMEEFKAQQEAMAKAQAEAEAEQEALKESEETPDEKDAPHEADPLPEVGDEEEVLDVEDDDADADEDAPDGAKVISMIPPSSEA
jgi:DNA-directed RNA polymerase subunit RPC12/RpoP